MTTVFYIGGYSGGDLDAILDNIIIENTPDNYMPTIDTPPLIISGGNVKPKPSKKTTNFSEVYDYVLNYIDNINLSI